jgi:hypothetical protein
LDSYKDFSALIFYKNCCRFEQNSGVHRYLAILSDRVSGKELKEVEKLACCL